jgi:hypothetical protein
MVASAPHEKGGNIEYWGRMGFWKTLSDIEMVTGFFAVAPVDLICLLPSMYVTHIL